MKSTIRFACCAVLCTGAAIILGSANKMVADVPPAHECKCTVAGDCPCYPCKCPPLANREVNAPKLPSPKKPDGIGGITDLAELAKALHRFADQGPAALQTAKDGTEYLKWLVIVCALSSTAAIWIAATKRT